MATARALHLVEQPPATVDVPVGPLTDAIANAGALADDLQTLIDAAVNRVWADSRGGALNALYAMSIRVDELRDDFTALDPRPTDPRRPHQVA